MLEQETWESQRDGHAALSVSFSIQRNKTEIFYKLN